MDVPEIEAMARLEAEHWWYVGLRGAIQRVLCMPQFKLGANPNVLDAGCGTGENLRMLLSLLQPVYAGGFDLSEHAVEWCRRKVGESADVYVSDIRDPDVHVDRLDLLLSCDVISIPGIGESMRGLTRLVDCLRPGGLFIHNMAAFQWLYSSHDVITHTRERATASRMRDVMRNLGLRIELLTYRVFWLFPAIVAARLPSILNRPSRASATSDLRPVNPVANRVFGGVMRVENSLIARGLPMPWGSSIFVVARKH